jgi:hypothetical protein
MSSTMRDVTTSGREEQTQEEKVTTVLDLVHGNLSLEREIVGRFESNVDDPPVLFEWVDTNLRAFWNKAVAYSGVANAHAPPHQINGGAHLAGVPDTDRLKQWILLYLAAAGNNGVVIDGLNGTIGFYCTGLQYGSLCATLGAMHNFPWFHGVLQQFHGFLQQNPPLPGVLAGVFVPRPRTNGICDLLTVGNNGGGTLWH